MHRLIILICQLNKSVTPTKYFFKVPLVGRLLPLVGVIGRSVESPLYLNESHGLTGPTLFNCYINDLVLATRRLDANNYKFVS